jgi:methylated-DNA-[protein]-cysteine S-methyltransferase
MTATKVFSIHESPVGPLLLSGDRQALTRLEFADGAATNRKSLSEATGSVRDGQRANWRRDDARFGEENRQIGEYFAGERTTFDFPLVLEGSSFERRVWEALQAIPYGTTITYGALAARLGAPGAARAVGAANGRNPIAIVVPCHRVIGARGTLTGYGGGLERKRALLAHEGALLPV